MYVYLDDSGCKRCCCGLENMYAEDGGQGWRVCEMGFSLRVGSGAFQQSFSGVLWTDWV